MAFKLPNGTHETSTTTSWPLTLDGAVADHFSFDAGLDSTDETIVRHGDGVDEEIAWAVFTAPSTLTLTAFISTTNGGSAVVWGAGTRDVTVLAPGEFLQDLMDPNGLQGILVRDATGAAMTFRERSVIGGTGCSVLNGNGVGGHPTVSVDQAFTPTWTGAHTFNAAVTLAAVMELQAATTTVPTTHTMQNSGSDRVLTWPNTGLDDHRIQNYVGGSPLDVLNAGDIAISALTEGHLLAADSAGTGYDNVEARVPILVTNGKYTPSAAGGVNIDLRDATIGAGFDAFVIDIVEMLPVGVGGDYLRMTVSTDTGASPIFESSGYDHNGLSVAGSQNRYTTADVSGTKFQITDSATNVGGDTATTREGYTGQIVIHARGDGTIPFRFEASGGYYRDTGDIAHDKVFGSMDSNVQAGKINWVRLQFDTVNISTGTIYVYGIRRIT